MPPTITMDHSDYSNVTYCADWRDPARLDSLHEVSIKGAAMKRTGIALAALLGFVSMPLAALADPSFYLGYTGKKWTKDYGVIAGTCDAAAVRASGRLGFSRSKRARRARCDFPPVRLCSTSAFSLDIKLLEIQAAKRHH